MQTSDFWFDLPEELIAQTPVEPRDSSRLLCVSREDGSVEHRHFHDLPSLLKPGDLLLANDSRVLPARLYGAKEGTGGAVELLLLEQKARDEWECLCRPGNKIHEGTRMVFGDGKLIATVTEHMETGNRMVRFSYEGDFYTLLDEIGKMPLPPYIHEELKNSERYQTVYSNEVGSAAAPTAGLHFTPELMKKLSDMGVDMTFVTLHVGLGTFRPVKVDKIEEHHMHSEHYHLSAETAEKINRTKANGGRVICVGTTSCRTLESVAKKCGCIREDEGYTDIFIYPGYQFAAMDGLITNFHLPESTLIMLVSAFEGYENTMNAYKIAVQERYRFFSFGDACLFI